MVRASRNMRNSMLKKIALNTLICLIALTFFQEVKAAQPDTVYTVVYCDTSYYWYNGESLEWIRCDSAYVYKKFGGESIRDIVDTLDDFVEIAKGVWLTYVFESQSKGVTIKKSLYILDQQDQGDVDFNGRTNIGDVTLLILYIFSGGTLR